MTYCSVTAWTLYKVNNPVHHFLRVMDDQACRINVSSKFDLHLDMAVAVVRRIAWREEDLGRFR
jgi:hypothetical protein